MFASLFSIIFTCVSCLSCIKHHEQKHILVANNTTITDTTSATTYKYLALGDSYTIGQNVAAKDRFPAQAAQLLQSHNIHITTVDYIATTGWATPNLLSAIKYRPPSANYDIVTLLVGVNDQYQHRDTAGYRLHFAELLRKSIQFAGNRASRVVVLSIPDYSATPFVAANKKQKVSREINVFNAINKQVTLANNIAYLDITHVSRKVATDSRLVGSDDLHPSGLEYGEWAAMLAPLIHKALQ